jgi:hypothetical protein
MNFDDFESMELSTSNGQGFVYVLCWTDGVRNVPFYVGQTQAILGRMNDYHWADFQASTDFRVGEAVKYLREKGLHVITRYRLSAASKTEREKEERCLIDALKAEGTALLNCFPGYDYRKSAQDEQRDRIRGFIDEILG